MINQYESPELRASRGFTLLELMLVITVAAVILGLAVPNFREFALNNRMTGAANDLLAAVHIARAEAIKRRTPIVMCFSSNPNDAAPNCDGDGTQGWIVFADDADPTTPSTNDNNVQVDTGEEVFIRHSGFTNITVNSIPSGNAGYVAYTTAGFRREVTGVGPDVDGVVLCDSRGNVALHGPAHSTARGFTVSPTGRPAITRAVDRITDLGGCL